jgi:hypothetical protein
MQTIRPSLPHQEPDSRGRTHLRSRRVSFSRWGYPYAVRFSEESGTSLVRWTGPRNVLALQVVISVAVSKGRTGENGAGTHASLRIVSPRKYLCPA